MNYTSVTEEAKKEFWNMIEEGTSLVISSHVSPDSDSLSSCLGLYDVIKTKYPEKNVRIMYSDIEQPVYNVFKNYEVIEWTKDIADSIGEPDVLVVLDVNRFSRISNATEKLFIPSKTICIDHHATPSDEFTFSIIDTNASSNAELIYKLTSETTVDKNLAELFLLGILGDTGNFAFVKPNQTEIFNIAKKLIDIAQIQIDEFQSRYRSFSKNSFMVLEELMNNTQFISIPTYNNFTATYISTNFLNENSLSDEDISGGKGFYVMNLLRKINGYSWGLMVTPKDDGICTVSFRSMKGSQNVRQLAERMEIGGGHDNAAGGKIINESDPEKAIEWLLKWMGGHTQD